METFKAIYNRRSVREFTKDKISKETIKKIIDAARVAPTARNEQPWEFIIVRDEKIKNTIARFATHGKFISQAPLCIAVYCKNTKYYLEDGCAATQNILIAAADLNIGSCWVAGDKKEYSQEISTLLNVPEQFKLISLIAIGVSVHPPVEKEKRKLEGLIHWEKF